MNKPHRDREDRVWAGTWVANRLNVNLRTTDAPLGVRLDDLVGLAVRRNPRRAHLLVSTVLGKHVPTDPRLVYAAGLLLGGLAAQVMTAPADAPAPHPPDRSGGDLLRLALAQATGAAETLLRHTQQQTCRPVPAGTVVLGYAETATALGHAVADALNAPCLHSTRRPVAGLVPVGGFEEEHSHATSHLLLPEDPALLAGPGPLVLVDDELSTGTTALNTVTELHAIYPRAHYVIAALVDLRSDADRSRMAQVSAALGARIDVVALAAGRVELPEDVLSAGQQLFARIEEAGQPQPDAGQGDCVAPVARVVPAGPPGLREGGRHGFTPADRLVLRTFLRTVAADVLDLLPAHTSVHVLGVEELMYAPLLLALELANRRPPVTYSTTTRSPVLAVADTGYAIRSRMVFAAHDNPVDGPGNRYAYNVDAVTRTDSASGAVVLVVDEAADTPELAAAGGLVDQLTRVARHVVLVVLPGYRPVPAAPPGDLL